MTELRKRQLLTRAQLDALDAAAKAEEKRHVIWAVTRGSVIGFLGLFLVFMTIRGILVYV